MRDIPTVRFSIELTRPLILGRKDLVREGNGIVKLF